MNKIIIVNEYVNKNIIIRVSEVSFYACEDYLRLFLMSNILLTIRVEVVEFMSRFYLCDQ